MMVNQVSSGRTYVDGVDLEMLYDSVDIYVHSRELNPQPSVVIHRGQMAHMQASTPLAQLEG